MRDSDVVESVDAMITVFHKDGSMIRVDARHEAELDRAFERLAGEGDARFTDDESRNSTLKLRTVGGEIYTVLASTLASYLPSTRASRRRCLLIDVALRAENSDLEPRDGHAEAGPAPAGAAT